MTIAAVTAAVMALAAWIVALVTTLRPAVRQARHGKEAHD
jgi:hypothetical protein